MVAAAAVGDGAHTIESFREPYWDFKHGQWDTNPTEGQMGVTGTVRQARLRPECAGRHPTLPAGMWTSAACVAELEASCPGVHPGYLEKPDKERVLSNADFEFRGGFARCPGGLSAGTRIDELEYPPAAT